MLNKRFLLVWKIEVVSADLQCLEKQEYTRYTLKQ